MTNKYYIDCEFDGHNGPLLSIGMVDDKDNCSLHIKVSNDAKDPWVLDNVTPILDHHRARVSLTLKENDVGAILRSFMGSNPTIISDSTVDIARFCRAISTSSTGEWEPTNYSMMTFEVHNINCYPTILVNAVQHNAWWDAMALREALYE